MKNINEFCQNILENRIAFREAYKDLMFLDENDEIDEEDNDFEDEEPKFSGTLSSDNLFRILKKSRYNRKMRQILLILMEYIDSESLNNENFNIIMSFPSRHFRELISDSLAHKDLSYYQLQILNQKPPYPFESCFSLINYICKYDCFKIEDIKKVLEDNSSILEISSEVQNILDECEKKYGTSEKIKEARRWIQNNKDNMDIKANRIREQWNQENKLAIESLCEMIRSIIDGKEVSEEEIEFITEELFMMNASISPELLESLTKVDNPIVNNNEFWESIVDAVSIDSLNDGTMQFLYDHHLATDSMSLKDLPESWLRKYAAIDEDTLYCLADQSVQKPDEDFMQFVKEYAMHSPSLFQYLLEITKTPDKWKMLLFLGQLSENQEIRDISEIEYEIKHASFLKDKDELRSLYNSHTRDSRWLISLADNMNTPVDILKQLKDIAEIKNSHKIRKKAKETLRFVEKYS